MVDQEALKSIEDLHRLKTEGVITEADFEKAKERLLFGAAPRTRPPVVPRSVAARPLGPVTHEPVAWGGIDPNLADHLGWVLLPLRRYADFEGRSSRKEFWMFQLTFVALGILGFVALAGAGEGSTPALLLLVAVALAALVLVIPQLAVQARRLHDQDKSGWLVLINLLPYVGALIVLVFMLIEGTPGDNRFGPDPRPAPEGKAKL